MQPHSGVYGQCRDLSADKPPNAEVHGQKHFAWLLCLPFRPGSRVLFVGNDACATGPAILSRLGHDVVTVPFGDLCRAGIDLKAQAGARFGEEGGPCKGVKAFDAILLHGELPLAHCLVSPVAGSRCGDFLNCLLSMAAPHTFIWFGAETGRSKKLALKLSPVLRMAMHARRRGLKLQVLYEFYPAYHRPFELITLYSAAGQFAIAKGAAAGPRANLKGAFKAALPNWMRTLCLSPGLGAVVGRDSVFEHEPFITALLKQAAGGEVTLLRLLSGNPDTLLLIYQSLGESYVLKLPFSAAALSRCETNWRALEEMASARFCVNAPAIVSVGTYGPFKYYIEQKLEGEAVDSDDYPVQELLETVLDFLLDFNKATARPTKLSRDLLCDLINPYLDLLLRLGDRDTESMLSWCSDYLMEKLLDQSLPLVYFHGDFKLENVLVKVRQRSVAGVIDWDLAVSSHLPALDMLHLLAYEQTVLSSTPVDVTVGIWWRAGFSGRSRELVVKYLDAMDISSELLHPLVMVYALHHFAARSDANSIPKDVFAGKLNSVLMSFQKVDRHQ